MDVLINPFIIGYLCSILIIAAITDLRSQKIPNLLTFSTMFFGIFYHTISNSLEGLVFSFGGLVLGITLFIVPYLMGGLGAGDAKLVGAVGAIIGPKGVLFASFFTAIVGGVYALIVFLLNIPYLKSFIKRSVLTMKTFAFTRHLIPIPADESEKKPKLCYGLAISIGTISYIFLDFLGYKFPIF